MKMKVRDLINQLQQFDAEDEVHLSYNLGDYWRTTVAPKIHRVEMLPVAEIKYNNKPMMIIDEEDKRYDEAEQVVVIS
jgi:hypothetical protein